MTMRTLSAPRTWRTRNRGSLIGLCGALLILTTGAVRPASGATLVSNLGFPPTFDLENGWQIDGGAVAGQIVAVSFALTTESNFTGAQVALGVIFSNLPESPITMYLAADAGGFPGVALADLQTVGRQNLDPWPPGRLETYVCKPFCPPPLSAETIYWLVAAISNSSSDYFFSQAAWNWNTTLDYASGSNLAYDDTQLGGGWHFGSSNELRPAFVIEGEQVPEPNFTLLLLVGLSALKLRASKRG